MHGFGDIALEVGTTHATISELESNGHSYIDTKYTDMDMGIDIRVSKDTVPTLSALTCSEMLHGQVCLLQYRMALLAMKLHCGGLGMNDLGSTL